jgi:two-component system, NtrC family, sensor kinase
VIIQERKANIMLIDDTPGNLRLLENVLSQRGLDVRPFTSGKMAIKAAENERPDLVLLDIMMPEMDGFEVCRQLKENEQLKDIPVIFISAMSETLDKIKAFSSGGVDYVTKPFQLEEVTARVETHLKLRQIQVELNQKTQKLQQTVNELKLTQKQLIQSEKMASLGVLTAGIAHEINNPVNYINASTLGLKIKLKPIIAWLNQLDDIQDLDTFKQLKTQLKSQECLEAIHELTTNISTGVERTVDIIKGLRAFSRVDQDDKKMANIHEGIDSTLILLRSQYKDTICIKKDYGSIPEIMCFPGKINQVLMNVLKNAVDAIVGKKNSNQQEKICIQTSLVDIGSKQHIKIKISDTGIGISDDVLARIFDPFFTTKAVGQGNGLGMYISLGIIESHEGKIEIISKVEFGSEVIITLPVKTIE